MANPMSSKLVSPGKPESVTNLEISDRGRSALHSSGLQITYDDVEQQNQTSNHTTSSTTQQIRDEGEIVTDESSLGSPVGASKYPDGNYQTRRVLKSELEVQWNDAEEPLPLGADYTFLKDQTGLQEAGAAQFADKAIDGSQIQCNQLPTADDQAKQTHVSLALNSVSISDANMMENIKSNSQAAEKEETLTKEVSMSSEFSRRINSVVKEWFRWGLATVNFGLELCQAATTQEAAVGKIKTGSSFQTLSALLSSICLILTVWEIAHDMRKDGVKWRKTGKYYFFYYPGKKAPAYGNFAIWFGLIIAIVQFAVNCTSLVTNTAVIKFDYLALLFSACYLIWAGSSSLSSAHGKRTIVGVVKCDKGHDRVEGRFKHGSWFFECVQCKMEKYV